VVLASAQRKGQVAALRPLAETLLTRDVARRMGAVNFRGGYIDGEVIDDVPGEVVAEQV